MVITPNLAIEVESQVYLITLPVLHAGCKVLTRGFQAHM